MEFAPKLSELEQRSKSNSQRLEKLEETTEAINRLAISLKGMAAKQDAMNDNISKLAGKVDILEAEPGKRWRAIVEKATSVVVGFVLAKVGME